MDTSNKIHISDELVVNKSYYETIEKEITCSICEEILVDPILCSECENPFCTSCIEEWLKKNNQCVMKCKAPFKSKAIQRMSRNIMDKVILKCKLCNKEISLNDYPSHYRNCELNNKTVDCPFCCNCKIKAIDYNKIDKNAILSSLPEFKQQIMILNQENKVLNDNLKNMKELNLRMKYECENSKSKN